MDNDYTMRNSTENESALLIGALIIAVMFLPITLSCLISRYTYSTIKKHTRIYVISYVIFLTTLVGTAITLILISDNNGMVKNYDYAFNFFIQIRWIFSLTTDTKPLLGDVGFGILSILGTSVTTIFIMVPLRKYIGGSYARNITYYKRMLAREEIVTDPRAHFTLVKFVWFAFLGLSKSQIENNLIGDVDITKHIMLNREIGIPKKNLNTHTAIVGTTGAGKTATTLLFYKNAIDSDKPIILIDGKGDVGLIKSIKKLAAAKDKKVHVFHISKRKIVYQKLKESAGIEEKAWDTIKYNPFAYDDPNKLVDIIMEVMEYSELHYKTGARVYLTTVIDTLLFHKMDITFQSLMMYSRNIEDLKILIAKRYGVYESESDDVSLVEMMESDIDPFERDRYNDDIIALRSVDPKSISGITTRLAVLSKTCRETIGKGGVTIADVISKKEIIIFSLNSLDYAEQSPYIGRLILNDIKASAEINEYYGESTLVAMDEFNVFASDNIIDILNKTRSKGYECLLAFQSIADLKNISQSFMEQVVENTNTKIIQKTNDPAGAEYWAKALGTVKNTKSTYVAEDDLTTGAQSKRVVNEYNAHPDEIKKLAVGEAYVKFTDIDGVVTVTEKTKIDVSEILKILDQPDKQK